MEASWIHPDPGLTLAQYAGQWLAHMRGRVRPSTHRGYEGLLRLYALPTLGEVPIAELHPLQLQALYGELLESGGPVRGRLSAGTVLNVHRVLVQSLGAAVRWGPIGSNPAAAAEPPRPRRGELPAVDPELTGRILVAAAGTPMELSVAMALATGMRRGEILGLRWSDLDADLTVAHVRRARQPVGGLSFQEPKSSRSRRTVALPAFLRPYLERQREHQAARRARDPEGWRETDLVIDAGDGSPVHPDTLSSGWIRLVRQAGLPHLRFHDLRHGHATLMLLQGVHPKIVSERLGHASIGITLDIVIGIRSPETGPSEKLLLGVLGAALLFVASRLGRIGRQASHAWTSADPQ